MHIGWANMQFQKKKDTVFLDPCTDVILLWVNFSPICTYRKDIRICVSNNVKFFFSPRVGNINSAINERFSISSSCLASVVVIFVSLKEIILFIYLLLT